MADFCRQCSIDNFGEDFADLEKLMDEDKYVGGNGAGVICEGCGPTVVDVEGVCISPYCLKHHGGTNGS